MKLVYSAHTIALLGVSLVMLSGCSMSGSTSGSVYDSRGYRAYHGGPWGGYHPPVYIIDGDIDEIDGPGAEQLPEFGPPDFDVGGMDGGFDSFDF